MKQILFLLLCTVFFTNCTPERRARHQYREYILRDSSVFPMGPHYVDSVGEPDVNIYLDSTEGYHIFRDIWGGDTTIPTPLNMRDITDTIQFGDTSIIVKRLADPHDLYFEDTWHNPYNILKYQYNSPVPTYPAIKNSCTCSECCKCCKK